MLKNDLKPLQIQLHRLWKALIKTDPKRLLQVVDEVQSHCVLTEEVLWEYCMQLNNLGVLRESKNIEIEK